MTDTSAVNPPTEPTRTFTAGDPAAPQDVSVKTAAQDGIAPIRAVRHRRGLGKYLLDHPALLLPLARHFSDSQPRFESSIRGPSMLPAIPPNTRLQVLTLGRGRCASGDVAYFWTDGQYMVHRIVSRARHWSGQTILLTCGDNRLMVDAPVEDQYVLGTVVATMSKHGWQAIAPMAPTSVSRRYLRTLSLFLMIMLTFFSTTAARHVAAWMLAMEVFARNHVRRFKRSSKFAPLRP